MLCWGASSTELTMGGLVLSAMECKPNQWTSTSFNLSSPQMSVVFEPRGLGSSHMCAGQGCWGVV